MAISGGFACAGIWLIIMKPMVTKMEEEEVAGVCVVTGMAAADCAECKVVRYSTKQVVHLGLVPSEERLQIRKCLDLTNRVIQIKAHNA